ERQHVDEIEHENDDKKCNQNTDQYRHGSPFLSRARRSFCALRMSRQRAEAAPVPRQELV
ncbi:MAG: hypothetical protein KDE55_15120, partial [Novosphingobium sp.]|nr:hypothetical protein [Novosphingobium sp.]